MEIGIPKNQAGTSQIPICPCPKTVNLLLNLYKLYHIKNRYTVFPDMNLEIDQAMKLFKEEILDLVLPNLQKIFQQFLMTGVDSVKQ